ncbi:MAG: hypothetical protein RMJ98_11915, partial [Myxococcales bacterium]|nr:hypothetical protein [Polyangiaceae bacterium]MDW8249992.1 hypothetical protein [Myxococcales bacterium]
SPALLTSTTMGNPNTPQPPSPSDDLVTRLLEHPYEPPCIEEDLPLEVMSLACQGFVPKGSTPTPCRTVGS